MNRNPENSATVLVRNAKWDGFQFASHEILQRAHNASRSKRPRLFITFINQRERVYSRETNHTAPPLPYSEKRSNDGRKKELKSTPTIDTADTDQLTLDTDQLTIDPSSTFETNPSFQTPTSASTPGVMTMEDREARAKGWCARKCGFDWENLDGKERVRAKELQSPDFSWSPGKQIPNEDRYKTTFRGEFDLFLQGSKFNWKNATYEYKGETYNSLFFEDEDMDKFMIIRRQKGGLCAFQASVTLQHYAECVKKRQEGIDVENHETFDISDYIRETASDEECKHYIRKGSLGTNSEAFLVKLLGLYSQDLLQYDMYESLFENEKDVKGLTEFMFEWYSKYRAPGILRHFAVSESFHEHVQGNATFDGKEKEENFMVKEGGEISRHAMVVIGMTIDEETGMLWFLVQNSWGGRYFQEVSAEYVASCGGHFLWFHLHTANISLKAYHPTINDEYAEAASPKGDENDVLVENDRSDGDGIPSYYFDGIPSYYFSDDGDY